MKNRCNCAEQLLCVYDYMLCDIPICTVTYNTHRINVYMCVTICFVWRGGGGDLAYTEQQLFLHLYKHAFYTSSYILLIMHVLFNIRALVYLKKNLRICTMSVYTLLAIVAPSTLRLTINYSKY